MEGRGPASAPEVVRALDRIVPPPPGARVPGENTKLPERLGEPRLLVLTGAGEPPRLDQLVAAPHHHPIAIAGDARWSMRVNGAQVAAGGRVVLVAGTILELDGQILALLPGPGPQISVPALEGEPGPALGDVPRPELPTFGRWRAVRRLGVGGMAEIFEVEHTAIGQRAVAKTIHPSLVRSEDVARRFMVEARAMSRVRHRNVITVFDVAQQGGEPYMILELLVGETLAERVQRVGAPALDESLRIVRAVAEGLVAVHAAGIVHRDVKQANVFLLADGGVKLFDFGIAFLPEGGRRLTPPGGLIGTPQYMAPERIEGNHEVEGRSDVYALGCILHELVTGRPLFFSETIAETFTGHLRTPPPPLEGVPAPLAALVARMLAKTPAERPTAAEVVSALAVLE
jgi:tRNA A-37 threonylcarbamoyl transferase component Bud32